MPKSLKEQARIEAVGKKVYRMFLDSFRMAVKRHKIWLEDVILELVKNHPKCYNAKGLWRKMSWEGKNKSPWGPCKSMEVFIRVSIDMIRDDELSLTPEGKVFLGPKAQLTRAKEKIKIKRTVLKLVRTNPGKMTTARLVSAVRCQSKYHISKDLVSRVFWGMVNRGELTLMVGSKWNLGPKAPKLRKK